MPDADITNWLQGTIPSAARPLLDAASFFGGTPGWLLLIGLAFWWSGSRLGVRVALAVSISAVLNPLLKWLLVQPRPYFLTDRIVALEASDGFGMPSGHAQGSATAWGAVAWWSGERWLWGVAFLATFLAGLARVYYGVHSLLQVVAGWCVGVAVVAVVSWLWSPVARWWERAPPAARWAVVLAPTAAALLAAMLMPRILHQGFEAPAEWVARHRSAAARLGPTSRTSELLLLDVTPAMRWTGGLLGACLVAAWYGSAARRPYAPESTRERALVTLIGVAAMAVVLGALEPLVRQWGAAAELARFALLLWTLGVVAPGAGRKLEARVSRAARSRPS